jgi:hypothetical protein
MKFKQLLGKINTIVENAPEHTEGGGVYIGDPQKPKGPSVLTDKGTFNLKLPFSVDAINSMLSGFSSRDYIDPDGITSVVKQKLNHFGLDFMCNGQLQDGENGYELVQYGSPQLGVYGQNPYDDVNTKGFKQGDGIKEKLGHSLKLIVNVQRMPTGLRKVNMMIVPTESSSYNSDSIGSDCGCMH